MRMMMTIQVPVEAGNRGTSDGSLNQVLQATMEKLKPEAAYFHTTDGMRGGFLVFDMADPSQVPEISEPLFHAVDARISFQPVMNSEDLQKGLGQSA